jgi:hypothetical protein
LKNDLTTAGTASTAKSETCLREDSCDEIPGVWRRFLDSSFRRLGGLFRKDLDSERKVLLFAVLAVPAVVKSFFKFLSVPPWLI